MKQAKTLKADELKLVLAYVATRRHSARNRAIVQTSFLSGMRAHELASLKLGDVVDDDGNSPRRDRTPSRTDEGQESPTCLHQCETEERANGLCEGYLPTAAVNRTLLPNAKANSLQRQHDVPAIPQSLYGLRHQRCKLTQRQANLHHQSRCKVRLGTSTGDACWPQLNRHHPTVHRGQRRAAEKGGRTCLTPSEGERRLWHKRPTK